MRVVIGCDHAGFPLKEDVIKTIQCMNHTVIDMGTFNTNSVDFPDYAEKACQAVQNGSADRAILICGSGVGVCMTANKHKGIYASVCHDTYSAHQGVEHDNMNTLCLGGRVIGPELAVELVRSFLSANFSGQENHARRVNKIKLIEEKNL